MKYREWRERHATKLIGLGIALVGLVLMWGGDRLGTWLPLLPQEAGALVGKLGEAVIIAGVLAVALDSHLKRALLREASRGLFEHMIGFDHEPELKDRIKQIAFETKLYRRDLRMECLITPSTNGGVTIAISSEQEILNQSLAELPYHMSWTFDESDRARDCGVTTLIGDGQPEREQITFEKSGPHRMTAKSRQIRIKPRSQKVRYRFTTTCTLDAPANYYHVIYSGIPTIDATVSIKAPEGWDVWVSHWTGSSKDQWHTSGLLMTGDHIAIHWRSPSNSNPS